MRHGAPLALAALLAVTACGGSATAHTAASHTASPNVLACQHFRVQGQKVKAVAAPTVADLVQAVAWVQEDESLATDPALRQAFRRWVADVNQLIAGHEVTGNPKTAVIAACARYGVKAA